MPRFGSPYYPQNYTKWKKAAQEYIVKHVKASLDGPLCVFIEFDSAVPVSYSKTKRKDAIEGLTWTRADIDNLIKSVFDAMTSAGVWHDDCQVVLVQAEKQYAERDEIRVRVVKALLS